MNEQNIVIEITDTEIRLVVGYVINNKPHLVYTSQRPINGLISHGEILDYQTLTQILSSMKDIRGEDGRPILTTNEVTVILPAIGLSIFQCKKSTKVSSVESIVEDIDVQNVIAQIEKEAVPNGSQIIDIIPDVFILDGNRTSTIPPIGQKSDEITLDAKVHTLPTRIVAEYKQVIENAKLSVRRFCLNSYAAAELGKYTNDIPNDYLLVDMGAEASEISLIGNHSPFETVRFQGGGTYIVNKIVDQFRVTPEKALEFLTNRGYSTRELTFEPVLASYEVEDGKVEFTQKDLNKIIYDYFENEYFPGFQAAFNTLLREYDDNIRQMPLVFIGGFSMMIGFEELAKKHFTKSKSINFLAPKAIGARTPQYSSCIGGLMIACSKKGALSEQQRKTNVFSR